MQFQIVKYTWSVLKDQVWVLLSTCRDRSICVWQKAGTDNAAIIEIHGICRGFGFTANNSERKITLPHVQIENFQCIFLPSFRYSKYPL
jgi:hypothetical protein